MKVRIRLSYRVLFVVLGTVFLVIFFAARIINNQFRVSIIDTMANRNSSMLEKVATTISNVSDCEYQELLTVKSMIESTLDNNYIENEELYKSFLNNICKENNLIAKAWLSIDNSYISDMSDSRRLVYAENSQYGIDIESKDVEYYTELHDDPFYTVRDNESAVVDEPKLSQQEGTKRTMTFCIAVPIVKDGSTIGALGADISINNLRTLIDTTCIEDEKSITILSANNMILDYFNPDLIGLQIAEIDSSMFKSDTTQANFFIIKGSTGADSVYCSKKMVAPANLGNTWQLIASSSALDINSQIGESLDFVTKVIIFGLALLAIIIFILSVKIVKPINKVNSIINKLSLGQVDDALKMDIESNDELGQMADSSNKVVQGLLQVTKFAENIGNGNSDYKFTPLSDKDVLGNAIIEMKNSLDRAKEEEVQRREEEAQLNWASNGINLFNKVLRVDNNDIKILAEEIIKNLTLYLDSQMGALYVTQSNREGVELISHIGFDKEKAANNSFVAPGDGLIGRAFLEKETIFISEIPANMDKISSGLGRALPKSALVVPLIYNKTLVGLIEIYSFKVLQQYQIAFVEKLSENIASTISTVKINGETAQLLEKSKKQAEVLEQQEEEIRQNMEEMQATQEESTEKEEELTSIISGFCSIVPIVHYDTSRRIIDANEDFLNLLKTKKEKLIGKIHKSELFMNEKEQSEHDKFWEELLEGNIMETEEMFVDGKKNMWLLERFIPVKDASTNEITEIVAVGIDITEQKKIEERIQMVQEGILPEDLKKNLGKQEIEVKQRLVDLTHLNMVYKNDDKKITIILKRYQEQIPAQIADIGDSVKRRDYKVMKMDIKSLKTKINYLGIKPIYNALDEMLTLIADNKDMTSIPQIYETIKANWDLAYTELVELLGNEA